MKPNKLALLLVCLSALLFPGMAFAQVDPGVRPGAINGQPTATPMNPLPLASVSSKDGSLQFFSERFSSLPRCGIRIRQRHEQQRFGTTV